MGGIGRIYFTAIDRYALRYGITGQAFDDFLLFIRALDDVFIQHVNAKRKEQADKNRDQD